MSHVRTQIRKEFQSELLIIPDFEGRVYATRNYPFQRDQLPACNIYIGDEVSEALNLSMGHRILNRIASVNVELFYQGTDAVDDAIDNLCVAVEQILGASLLASLVSENTLTGTTFDFNADGEQIAATAVMQYQATYQTSEDNPEQAGG
jgi:hypothetical protein